MGLIRDFMDRPVVKIITGMRRSGKSALLELTRQELLRHAVMGYWDNDVAGILENTVYLELLRRFFSVNIGKQGVAEVHSRSRYS